MEIRYRNSFQLLPPAPELCQVCAAKVHGDEMPHNRDSLFYQVWFNSTYGRAATWADASLLCSKETREALLAHLNEYGVKPDVIGNLLESVATNGN